MCVFFTGWNKNLDPLGPFRSQSDTPALTLTPQLPLTPPTHSWSAMATVLVNQEPVVKFHSFP